MLRLNKLPLRQVLQSRWLGAVLLFSALQTTFMLWMSERQHAEALHEIKFHHTVTAAEEAVQQTLHSYLQGLRSVEQLYAASNEVESDEFKLFVADIVRQHADSGVRAIGFIRLVELDKPSNYRQLDASAWQRLEQSVASPAQRLAAPVLFIEPADSDNRRYQFSDVFAQPALQAALMANRDREHLLMTRHLALPAMPGNSEYSYYYPILRRAAGHTHAESSATLIGWVFLQFDVAASLQQTLNRLEHGQFLFQVQDEATSQGLLYATPMTVPDTRHASRWSQHDTLQVYGNRWHLQARTTTAFDDAIDYSDANRVGLIGMSLSLLLAMLLTALVMRQRNEQALEAFNVALNQSEQRWKFALESTGDGIWDWNVPAASINFSEGWRQMLGYAADELGDRPESWHQRIFAEDYPAFRRMLQQVLAGERNQYALEYRMLCKDGSWKWVYDRGTVFGYDSKGKPVRIVGTLADISKIKQSEDAIWQYANMDMLTNLPNRRMFYNRLDQELRLAKRRAHKLVVLFLDLDRFKEVNDTLGHDQGDVLLQEAAQRLVSCVTESDMVSRLGGDEFVLMLPDASMEQVESVARQILDKLAAPFRLDQNQVYVSASLGIAISPDDADNKEDLMKRVDQAMYASKQKGGNCFTYFTPLMQAFAERRMQLSNDMRKAIQQQQFFIEYQPVIDLKSHAVIKAEALIRWQHPQLGVVPPVDFIGIAEDNLQIIPIGQWVFRTAVEQCRLWRKHLHPDFQVAVNKSPVQFTTEQRDHQDWLTHMLQHGLQGGMVVVEITERLLLDADAQVRERLAQYRNAGVQLALDDFGTGYSALSYLKKFPIDYVKIDRAFVRELGASAEDEALCKAIIVMAHSLGMQVIAEGIESQQQLDMLRKMGCDHGQGFYFSPPKPPQAFEAWCQQWQKTMAGAEKS